MTGKTYQRYAQGRAKKSPLLLDCTKAFAGGGLICAAGEGLKHIWLALGFSKDNAGLMVSVTLIFITALLTGFGVFDNIAKQLGGGTLVPITGFANAVTSAAIDNKTEGYVTGVGAKIFTVAGPVILYGTVAGVIYGAVYWAMITLF